MYKLLLIDDEPWILKDMEQIIDWQEAGFQIVATVNDVQIAESLLRRQQIDVVISDIRMPGKSGLDLLAFVNRVTPRTLVVLMSAYSEFSYAKQAIENGCFNYLLKPVNVEELQQTLNKCAERLAEKEQERRVRLSYEHSMLLLEWIERDSSMRHVLNQLISNGQGGPATKRYAFVVVKGKAELAEEQLLQADQMLGQSGVSFFRGRVSSSKWTYFLGLPMLDARSASSTSRMGCRD